MFGWYWNFELCIVCSAFLKKLKCSSNDSSWWLFRCPIVGTFDESSNKTFTVVFTAEFRVLLSLIVFSVVWFGTWFFKSLTKSLSLHLNFACELHRTGKTVKTAKLSSGSSVFVVPGIVIARVAVMDNPPTWTLSCSRQHEGGSTGRFQSVKVSEEGAAVDRLSPKMVEEVFRRWMNKGVPLSQVSGVLVVKSLRPREQSLLRRPI